jgi:hypothetical protein
MWSALRAYWFRASTPRRCLLLGSVLAVSAPTCSLLGALVLSRALRSSVTGWGDPIGGVLGIYLGFYLGFWLAASGVFVIASRLASRPRWVVYVGAAGLLPSTAYTVTVTTNFGTPFPVTIVFLWVLVSLCATWVGSPSRRSRDE